MKLFLWLGDAPKVKWLVFQDICGLEPSKEEEGEEEKLRQVDEYLGTLENLLKYEELAGEVRSRVIVG